MFKTPTSLRSADRDLLAMRRRLGRVPASLDSVGEEAVGGRVGEPLVPPRDPFLSRVCLVLGGSGAGGARSCADGYRSRPLWRRRSESASAAKRLKSIAVGVDEV